MLCPVPLVFDMVIVTTPVPWTETIFGSKAKLLAFMTSAAPPGVTSARVVGADAQPASDTALAARTSAKTSGS